MATKKYVSPSRLSKFLEVLIKNFAPVTHKHVMSDITDVDSYEFISVDEIDEICGSTIVNANEVTF